MASVQVRTRRRSRNASAPVSVEFTRNGADAITAQAASWDKQLRLAQDLQAMQRLADGSTDQFIEFATARLKDPDLDKEQKAYWKGWLDDSTRKVAEETLAAEIAAGSKKLEDMSEYTSKRLKEVGTGSSEYPTLVKQLADLKQGILARDFNSEIAQAQEALVRTGNRTDYLEKLQTIATRTRSTDAQRGLAEQIGKLRVEIEKEKTTARGAQANKKLVAYYAGGDGAPGRAEILKYLGDMAETAGSTAEANHYTVLASQIDTRERTLQRQALAGAASSGLKALEAGLFKYEEGYKDLDAKLVVALRGAKSDRGALEDSYNTFEAEAADYETALVDALANATTTAARKAITTDLNGLRKNVAERQKQVSGAVTDNILENATDLLKQAGAEGTDADTASQFRFLAIRDLEAGLADSLAALNGDQLERLSKMKKSAAADQKAAIAKEAKVLAGSPSRFDPQASSAYDAAYDRYTDYFNRNQSAEFATDVKDKKGKAVRERIATGPLASFAEFVAAVDSGEQKEMLRMLGLNVKYGAAVSAAGGWAGDIDQVAREQERKKSEAKKKIGVLVAPRGEDGRRTEFAPPREPVDPPPAWGPNFVPTSSTEPSGAQGMAWDPAASDLAIEEGARPPAPVATSAGKSPGMMRVELPDDEPDDPYSAAERLAFTYLMSPTSLEYPGYEIPDPPALPDFTPEEDFDAIADAPIVLRRGLRMQADGALGGYQEMPGRGMGGALPAFTGASLPSGDQTVIAS